MKTIIIIILVITLILLYFYMSYRIATMFKRQQNKIDNEVDQTEYDIGLLQIDNDQDQKALIDIIECKPAKIKKYVNEYKRGEINDHYIGYIKKLAEKQKIKKEKQQRFFQPIIEVIIEEQKADMWEDIDEYQQQMILQQIIPQVQPLTFNGVNNQNNINKDQNDNRKKNAIEQRMIKEKHRNDAQNVHQSAVVRSAKNILDTTVQNLQQSNDPIKDQQEDIIEFIRNIECEDAKKKENAIQAVKHISESNHMIQGYNMSESKILESAVQMLKNGSQQENKRFLIEQLSDCYKNGRIDICPMGRATRIIDVMGLASDQKILPDYAIKEQIMTKMNNLYQDESLSKEQQTEKLDQYITQEFIDKKILPAEQKKEYMDTFNNIL